jgi:hypothetical protein
MGGTRVNIHRLRMAGVSDQAIVDLLQLQQLGLAPGKVQTNALRELWCCSQSFVSRRMSAVHGLGVVQVRSRWGGYTVCDQNPPRNPTPKERCTRDPKAAAQRWEAMRQKWQQVVA